MKTATMSICGKLGLKVWECEMAVGRVSNSSSRGRRNSSMSKSRRWSREAGKWSRRRRPKSNFPDGKRQLVLQKQEYSRPAQAKVCNRSRWVGHNVCNSLKKVSFLILKQNCKQKQIPELSNLNLYKLKIFEFSRLLFLFWFAKVGEFYSWLFPDSARFLNKSRNLSEFSPLFKDLFLRDFQTLWNAGNGTFPFLYLYCNMGNSVIFGYIEVHFVWTTLLCTMFLFLSLSLDLLAVPKYHS